MLSERGQHFLQALKRREVPIDPIEVAELLRSRKLPAPDAILAIQETYGGCTFHAGLQPLVATILLPRADYLRDQAWTAPDVTTEGGELMFRCFDTLSQCEFHLDQQGVFFENWKPVHVNFDHVIESKALLAGLSQHGVWKQTDARNEFSDPASFPKAGFQRDEAASCRYTSWRRNEDTLVQWRSKDVTI